MGLLDIDVKLDEIITVDYLQNNGWFPYTPIQYISWVNKDSLLHQYCAKKFNVGDYGELWVVVQFDKDKTIIHNLLTGEKFETSDVLTLDTIIEEWVENFF